MSDENRKPSMKIGRQDVFTLILAVITVIITAFVTHGFLTESEFYLSLGWLSVIFLPVIALVTGFAAIVLLALRFKNKLEIISLVLSIIPYIIIPQWKLVGHDLAYIAYAIAVVTLISILIIITSITLGVLAIIRCRPPKMRPYLLSIIAIIISLLSIPFWIFIYSSDSFYNFIFHLFSI